MGAVDTQSKDIATVLVYLVLFGQVSYSNDEELEIHRLWLEAQTS
jgi:hypothetical protein